MINRFIKTVIITMLLLSTVSIFSNEGFIKVIKSRDIDGIYSYYEEHKPEDGLYSNGFSPVLTAMFTYDYKTLRAVLELGYDPNYKTEQSGTSPLMVAAENNSLYKQQRLLLDHGAEIYDEDDRSSSFLTAIKSGASAYINLLLDRGINIKRAIPENLDITEILVKKWKEEHGERLLQELYRGGYVKNIGKYLHIALSDKWNRELFDILLKYTDSADYIYNDLSLIYRAITEDIPWRIDRIDQLLKLNPDLTPPLPGGRPLILEYITYENIKKKDNYRRIPYKHLKELLKRTPSEDFTYMNESVLSGITFFASEEQILKTLEFYKDIKESEYCTFDIYADLKGRGLEHLLDKVSKNLTYTDYITKQGWSLLGVLIYYDYTKKEIDFLLNKGLNINILGFDAGHIIGGLSKKDDFETIIYLAEKGAVIENEDVIYKHQRWNKRTQAAMACVKKLEEMGAIKNVK